MLSELNQVLKIPTFTLFSPLCELCWSSLERIPLNYNFNFILVAFLTLDIGMGRAGWR